MNTTATHITIANDALAITTDLFGGAIVDVHLKNGTHVNPLSFAFTKEQMPENNKAGAPYQGHFLCLGHWGLPSAAEIKAGVPNHGHFANTMWWCDDSNTREINMQAVNTIEGLQVKRNILLHENAAVVRVTEQVKNFTERGRLYNMVQHPTLAAPFLNDKTVVDCNGTSGFDQAFTNEVLQWPFAKTNDGEKFNVRASSTAYNAVITFLADPLYEYSWVTAYAPEEKLLFGYLWKRADYPWIHLWQHFEEGEIKYRGLEFGTAAFHQPLNEIFSYGLEKFYERTTAYIDAGEIVEKNYWCFLQQVNDVQKINSVKLDENNLIVVHYNDHEKFVLK